MVPSAPRPDFPIHLSPSSISTFKSCPMKFYYSVLRRLSGDTKSIHLVAGNAFAAGLEAARRYCFTPPDKLPDSLKNLPPVTEGGMHVAAYKAFSKAWGDADFNLDHNKSIVNVWYALDQYLIDYNPFTDFIQPQMTADGTPQVEFSFAIPLPIPHPVSGDPILLVGRFDMFGIWENLPVIVDEKTTTALGESWRRQWDLRGQFLGYCWACQQLGFPVTTAIARGTGILKTKVTFMTVPIIYPQHLIDRWYEDLLFTVKQMIAFWETNSYPLSLGQACTEYGGCSYSMLCSAKEPEEWTSNYVIREWNPLSAGATSAE